MIRIDNAPVPVVQSRRKLGLEIEVDVGHGGSRESINRSIQGWSLQGDGSLANGIEFIFDGPVLVDTAKERVERFCTTIKDVNVHRRGGYHVHVQGNNYSHADSFSIALLYTKCQNVINKLVASSRIDNTYCKAWTVADFRNGVEAFIRTCNLTTQSSPTRGSAKHVAGRYRTVNLNMMSCRDENQRSIEFRQGSVSKRFAVVFGWATLVLALAEAAKDNVKVNRLPENCSLQDMLAFLRDYERSSGSTNVSNWVQWRYDYLNQKPDDAELRLALETIAGGPVGLYGLSRKLDINLAVCKRLLDELTAKNLIFKRPNGTAYIASYEFKAEEDLKTILTVLATRQAPVETAAQTILLQTPPLIIL